MNSDRRELFFDRKLVEEGPVRDAAKRREVRRGVRAWCWERNERRVYRPKPRTHSLIVAPSRVSVRSYLPDRQGTETHELPRRGDCRGWSPRVRQRFQNAISGIYWPDAAYWFQTLTYPGEFVRDPEIWKLQLKAWAQAYRRRYGPLFAVWVLEFQRRGAPHFHIVGVAPEGFDLEEMRVWSAAAWHRVVTGCSGDHDHGVGLGADCDPWHYERAMADGSLKLAHDAKGAVQYLKNELGKESQKSLPAWLEVERRDADGRVKSGAGRWWGRWGLEISEEAVELADDEVNPMRRNLRNLGERYMRRRALELRKFKARKIARGEIWEPRVVTGCGRCDRCRAGDHRGCQNRRAPGAWLRPPAGMGLTIRDPELHEDRLATNVLAALASMRGAVRGSFLALDAACPQPRMGWA